MAIKTKIKAFNHQGKGIGNYNGKVYFIPDTIPEEEISFEIIDEKKNYGLGKVTEFLTKSKDRITPNCPYYQKCGGCHLSHMKYEKQLEFKKATLIDILRKYSDIEIEPKLIAPRSNFNYRNKITLKIMNNKWGYYKEESHNFVQIDSCLIAKDSINKIIKNNSLFNIKNGEITIRTNQDNEILININTKDKINLDLDKLSGLNIIGVILNNNLLYGQKSLTQKVGEYSFQVDYNSFFQINLEILSEVLKILNQKKYRNALDLYCGVGTLGTALNKQKLIGIESSNSSIKNAKINNKLNKQKNTYVLGDSSKLKEIDEDIDVVVVDPPRSGMNKPTLRHLLEQKPKEIIYMSCNPVTLASDLKELKKYFNIKEVYLLDMFPETYHIETLIFLELKKEKLIDLHMHTTYSDGTDSLPELLKKCEEKNLALISITDHDGVEAYFELYLKKLKNIFLDKLLLVQNIKPFIMIKH